MQTLVMLTRCNEQGRVSSNASSAVCVCIKTGNASVVPELSISHFKFKLESILHDETVVQDLTEKRFAATHGSR